MPLMMSQISQKFHGYLSLVSDNNPSQVFIPFLLVLLFLSPLKKTKHMESPAKPEFEMNKQSGICCLSKICGAEKA